MLDKIVNNIIECETLANKISKNFSPGDVISLEGELGTGKTTFVKGILKGLNYKEEVTSPTFTLINEYNADIKVIHIDFYREMNIERWLKVGINEYLYSDNIVIIEWGNLIPALLPKQTVHITFEHLALNKRRIYSYYENFGN